MKKLLAIAFLVLIIGLTACDQQSVLKPDERTTSTGTTTENVTSTLSILPNPNEPESIELMPNNYQSEFPFTPSMRKVYFLLPNELMALCPPGTYTELFEQNKDDSEPTEMAVMTLIKHFNTSKEEFEEAITKEEERYILTGRNMMHENSELPNPDIIYTFDNKIINAYYRRENPVAPDWLGTERAKDYTYESYSEYLKANPQ